jgi:phosphoserine phosphatase RsbU/P
VLVNSILVRSPDGAPRVIRTSVFDATDRREYERELVRARERAEQSEGRARQLAQTLQRTLIPPAPPTIEGLDVAAAYRPAGAGDEVGGDFYDVFETAEGDWVVVVGDVCGKGVQAAAVTSLARHSIRAAAMRESSPSCVLASLNATLLHHSPDRFCTVVCLRVRPDAGGAEVTVASGGHALPLVLSGGAVETVGRPGALLGVFAAPELHDATLRLAPGEALFAFTDGLTEGRRGAELFGDDRLRSLLRSLSDAPRTALPARVIDEIVRFQDGLPRDDMAAVLVGAPTV